MVVIQRYPSRARQLWGSSNNRILIFRIIIILSLMLIVWWKTSKSANYQLPQSLNQAQSSSTAKAKKLRKERMLPRLPEQVLFPPPKDKEIPVDFPPCPYESIADLTPEELHPQEGARHMVTPPAGGTLSLVCCHTTKGPMSIAVHSSWAPHGSKRFLDMVRSGYFNSGVPIMRCIEGFVCQFGLAGKQSRAFSSYIPDDPMWLPQGPTNRYNSKGVARFPKGFLAFAGNAPQSRSNQFILSLQPSGPLGGGSSWEVPWGELVGAHSFETMSHFFSGYGENGPPQPLLWTDSAMEKVQEEWPLLDIIKSCQLVEQRFES